MSEYSLHKVNTTAVSKGGTSLGTPTDYWHSFNELITLLNDMYTQRMNGYCPTHSGSSFTGDKEYNDLQNSADNMIACTCDAEQTFQCDCESRTLACICHVRSYTCDCVSRTTCNCNVRDSCDCVSRTACTCNVRDSCLCQSNQCEADYGSGCGCQTACSTNCDCNVRGTCDCVSRTACDCNVRGTCYCVSRTTCSCNVFENCDCMARTGSVDGCDCNVRSTCDCNEEMQFCPTH